MQCVANDAEIEENISTHEMKMIQQGKSFEIRKVFDDIRNLGVNDYVVARISAKIFGI